MAPSEVCDSGRMRSGTYIEIDPSFRMGDYPSSGAKSSRPSRGIRDEQQKTDKFKTEEMRSGSRFTVVPESFAHLVHQRIAREGFLKEEALIQEVFVASVVFKVA